MNPRLVPLMSLVLLLVASLGGSAIGQSTSVAGHWEGAIKVPKPGGLEVDVDLRQKDGSWEGDISIPEQNATDLPLTKIKVDGADVAFTIDEVPGEPTFTGKLSEDGNSLTGTFSQGGQEFPFSLQREAAETAPAPGQSWPELKADLEDLRKQWNLPGLAVAIVYQNKIVFSEGFGYRDVEKKLPVTPQTLFAIGSSTKAFTTFALGLLVEEGVLSWNKTVRQYLPDFKLKDPIATSLMTPRDLVTHCSGLPRHDALWYNNNSLSRADVVKRLQHLEPTEEFRAAFQYNNPDVHRRRSLDRDRNGSELGRGGPRADLQTVGHEGQQLLGLGLPEDRQLRRPLHREG